MRVNVKFQCFHLQMKDCVAVVYGCLDSTGFEFNVVWNLVYWTIDCPGIK